MELKAESTHGFLTTRSNVVLAVVAPLVPVTVTV